MTDPAPRPLLRRPGEGELLSVGGVAHLFMLTGADTAGAFAAEEFSLAPGVVGARPHVHHGHDEFFYVLEGELTLHDGEGEVAVGPGHLLAALRGVPHGYRNAGTTTARALCLYTPAGYENYFRDIHAAATGGAELTDQVLAEFRRRHATESFPPEPAS